MPTVFHCAAVYASRRWFSPVHSVRIFLPQLLGCKRQDTGAVLLARFHGIFARRRAIGQKSVSPAPVSPRATNPARKTIGGYTVNASTTELSNSSPAASRTCRSSAQRDFALTTSGNPAFLQASVPPRSTARFPRLSFRNSAAIPARVPPLQISTSVCSALRSPSLRSISSSGIFTAPGTWPAANSPTDRTSTSCAAPPCSHIVLSWDTSISRIVIGSSIGEERSRYKKDSRNFGVH